MMLQHRAQVSDCAAIGSRRVEMRRHGRRGAPDLIRENLSDAVTIHSRDFSSKESASHCRGMNCLTKFTRASCGRRRGRGIKGQMGEHHAARVEIARNCHIRASVMRGLDADSMRGAGICAESGRSGGERVQGHVDRDLDAG